MKAIACVIFAVLLQGCAVNVVTVNVQESELGYVDSSASETVNESNLGNSHGR